MPIDANEYDAFGRIFGSGGEQSFALALHRGYSQDRIDSIMFRRFGDDYQTAGGTLAGFAGAMIAAGIAANRAAAGEDQLVESSIPRNEFLPEEEMGGSRYKWAANVTFEGASDAVTVYFYTTNLDIENAVAEAISGGNDIVDNYRQKFGISEIAELTPLNVEFISVQSSY